MMMCHFSLSHKRPDGILDALSSYRLSAVADSIASKVLSFAVRHTNRSCGRQSFTSAPAQPLNPESATASEDSFHGPRHLCSDAEGLSRMLDSCFLSGI